jgi:predicted metal-dependent TIM-barrel fold hydrolase
VDEFLLNSDISNMPSDSLFIPKTIRTLEKLDFNSKETEKIAFKNTEKFFNI